MPGADLGAMFSPDGALLAAPVRRRGRWSVALVDTRSGASRIIPGSRTGRRYPDIGWSRSGWLFIHAGERVRAYRPGAARAETLPIRVPEWVLGFTVV